MKCTQILSTETFGVGDYIFGCCFRFLMSGKSFGVGGKVVSFSSSYFRGISKESIVGDSWDVTVSVSSVVSSESVVSSMDSTGVSYSVVNWGMVDSVVNWGSNVVVMVVDISVWSVGSSSCLFIVKMEEVGFSSSYFRGISKVSIVTNSWDVSIAGKWTSVSTIVDGSVVGWDGVVSWSGVVGWDGVVVVDSWGMVGIGIVVDIDVWSVSSCSSSLVVKSKVSSCGSGYFWSNLGSV